MRLTLYSRAGCHLCDEMKAVVARVRGRHAFDFEEIDVSTNAELERRYGTEIPVLEIDGKKIAKYRIDEIALGRALEARRGRR